MSEVYKIEAGIPLVPQKNNRQPGANRNETMKDGYPFTSLSVGDSFVFSDPSIIGRSAYWSRKLGMRFVSRTINSEIKRMWRVK